MMRRFRIWILAGGLCLILWALGRVQRSYQERAARLRSQQLVTLLEGNVQGPSRLLTSSMVAAMDAALVPQVRVLLRRPVPVNAWGRTYAEYEGQQEFTPLMMAAKGRLPRCVQELIDAGACLDTVDQDGRTALIWAVKEGNSNVVRVLLDEGANPDVVDRRGRTAIDYAYAGAWHWDRPEASLRLLKRAHAHPGPHALAR